MTKIGEELPAAMTNNEAIGEELLFNEVRKFSPQWNVTFRETVVARVTERYLKTPMYVLNLISEEGLDLPDFESDDREIVFDKICDHVRALGLA